MIKFETTDIQRLAKQAGVSTPVMSVRVVGSRIELHLLGGAVVVVPPSNNLETTTPKTGQHATNVQPFTPQDVLNDMSTARLKQVAAYLELTGYSKLTKAKLIRHIMDNATDAMIQDAVINSAFQ